MSVQRSAILVIGVAFLIVGAGLWLARSPSSVAPPSIEPSRVESPSVGAAKMRPSMSAEVKSTSASLSDPEAAQKQLRTLEEILASRNDNDPRLDSELKVLSEETKSLFRAKYQAIAPEKRNERGAIVFLLGRNLTTVGDYDFLKQVLSEHPCLSLADCSRPTAQAAGEDHHAGSMAIVLAYPQLTALKALQKSAPSSPELKTAARDALAAARASSSPVVSSYSEKVQLPTL